MTYANKIILFTSVILVGLATGKSSFFSDCGQFICANSAQAQDVETLTSQIETLDQRSDYLLKTKSEAWESLSRIRDEREETRKLLEKLKTVPLASGETEISRGIRISLTEDKVSQQTERLDDVSNEILKKEDELSEIGGAKGWPPSGT